MKYLPGLMKTARFAGLLMVLFLGLVSIVGTGGGGNSSPDPKQTFYRDADGDGYGDPDDGAKFDSQPIGYYVTDKTDCDDTNPAVNPGATERCDDGRDNDCDGRVDVGCVCTDEDGDGIFAQIGCGTARDCDDANAAVYPGAAEICWDDIDNNCNGLVDEGCTCTDGDGDGYYAQDGCGTAADCDDADAAVYPGATEICGDGIDDDCDGVDLPCGGGGTSVPDTGQTACYNNTARLTACPARGRPFYGQDAAYTIRPPSYSYHGNAGEWVIRDNVTGLMWEIKSNQDDVQNYNDPHDADNLYTRQGAVDDFIARLNSQTYAGYSDWRLPTSWELISIVNYGTFGPAIDGRGYFRYTRSAEYWSSGVDPAGTDGPYRVNFIFGYDYQTDASGYHYARAVRGQRPPAPWTDNNDGTVTDNATGLMWAQATAPDALVWRDALAWCENLALAGYSDWRLPTIKELESLMDDGSDGSQISLAYFPDTVSSYYWTSTTNAYYTEDAWVVNFSYGHNSYGNKAGTYYVRAVRGGQ